MEALEAVFTRRSTRRMKPDLPPREEIKRIVEAGRAAPGGSNSRSSHMIVIMDRTVLSDLADFVQKAFAGMETGPDAYVSLRHSVEAAKAFGRKG